MFVLFECDLSSSCATFIRFIFLVTLCCGRLIRREICLSSRSHSLSFDACVCSPSPSALHLFLLLSSREFFIWYLAIKRAGNGYYAHYYIECNKQFFWAYTQSSIASISHWPEEEKHTRTYTRIWWWEDDGLYMVNRHVDVRFYVPFFRFMPFTLAYVR